MINLRMKILEELGDDLGGNIQFDVGYYENPDIEVFVGFK